MQEAQRVFADLKDDAARLIGLPPKRQQLVFSGANFPSIEEGRQAETIIAHSPRNGGFAIVVDTFDERGRGQLAGKLARDLLVTTINTLPQDANETSIKGSLQRAFMTTSREISKHLPGARSSVTLARFSEDDRGHLRFTVAHFGSTRAYLWHNDRLKLLTIDDGIRTLLPNIPPKDHPGILEKIDRVETADDKAKLPDRESYLFTLRSLPSPGGARLQLFRHLLGSGNNITPAFSSGRLKVGDMIILASGGLENLSRRELELKLKFDDPSLASSLAQTLASEAYFRSIGSLDRSRVRAKIEDIAVVTVKVAETT